MPGEQGHTLGAEDTLNCLVIAPTKAFQTGNADRVVENVLQFVSDCGGHEPKLSFRAHSATRKGISAGSEIFFGGGNFPGEIWNGIEKGGRFFFKNWTGEGVKSGVRTWSGRKMVVRRQEACLELGGGSQIPESPLASGGRLRSGRAQSQTWRSRLRTGRSNQDRQRPGLAIPIPIPPPAPKYHDHPAAPGSPRMFHCVSGTFIAILSHSSSTSCDDNGRENAMSTCKNTESRYFPSTGEQSSRRNQPKK